ncbi:MAG: hypothetical protein ACOC1P_00355 [Minisyncoccales bacterium]
MKLKVSLLFEIIGGDNSLNKYSRGFEILENVIQLEKKENEKFDLEIESKFKELKKRYMDFLNGIPLKVLEKHYINKRENLNKELYLEFMEKEVTNFKVIEIYLLLEDFYRELFSVACMIANFYNIEPKINNKNSEMNTIEKF